MKKRIFLIAIAIVFGVMGSAIFNYISRPYKFIDRAFEQMQGNSESEMSADIYQLDSGESFTVILEHACCSGDGFDAVAIRTSAGVEFYATKNYCGIEGFWGSVVSNDFKNLDELTSFLLDSGYKKN